MEIGGGARGPATREIGGRGVCGCEIEEKRGESLHVCGTVSDIRGMDTERRRWKVRVYVCCRQELERFIDRCVSERSCGDSGRTT